MFPAFLIQVVVVLVVVGLILWALSQIPMDATIARILRVVIIVVVCLWLLYVLVGYLPAGGYPGGHGRLGP
jgi:hypothetical protein